jgi:hypothetical protein
MKMGALARRSSLRQADWFFKGVEKAASKTLPEHRTWWPPEKRRDEFRRGRQECLRHIGPKRRVFKEFGGPPWPMVTDKSVCGTSRMPEQ